MIDYEVKIFNAVHAVAAPLCAKNQFVSTLKEGLTALPAGALYEMDNATVQRRQSSEFRENFARITYQAESYAGTKAECRKLAKAIDDKMVAMNFNRVSGQYLRDPNNMKVVRYVARYVAVIDPNGVIYRVQ